MSGGPVFNEHGKVAGVICSSFGEVDDQGHISYASLIGPALLIQIDAETPDGVEKKFLYDFVDGGAVRADSTMDTISIERSEAALTMDFGQGSRFTNKLPQQSESK